MAYCSCWEGWKPFARDLCGNTFWKMAPKRRPYPPCAWASSATLRRPRESGWSAGLDKTVWRLEGLRADTRQSQRRAIDAAVLKNWLVWQSHRHFNAPVLIVSVRHWHGLGKGGQVDFRWGRLTVASRFQADPPQPVARYGCLEREGLVPVQGPDRVAASQLFLSDHLRLPGEPGR